MLGVAACGLGTVGTEEVAGAPDAARAPDGTIADADHATDASASDSTNGDGSSASDVVSPHDDGSLASDVVSPHDGSLASDVVSPPPVDGGGGTDACTPSGPEICTDGVDNDCNGLVDCADPACMSQGYSCVPSVPAGWSFASTDLAARPPCPTGSGPATPIVVDPVDAPATCPCTCAPTLNPSCVSGTLEGSYGNTSSCSNGPDPYSANDGSCVNMNLALLAFVGTPALPPTGPSTCGPTVSPMVPAAGGTQGELCSVSGPFGAGCGAGDICALAGEAPFNACLTQSGASSCPAGYPVSHAAGSSLTDTRGCGACGCGAPTVTCTDASWTFYPSVGCQGGGTVALTCDGKCDASNASPSAVFQSYKYSASPDVVCGVPTQPAAPTGSLTLSDPSTVCCTQ